MARKSIWGIDITGQSVKGVLMRQAKSGPEIIEADMIPLPDTGSDEEAREEAIHNTLIKFIQKNNISGKIGVAISLSGSTTFSRPVTLPPVQPNKLREIVEYEAQQYIPFPITDVVWDYHILNPEAQEMGEEPQVMLFAVRRESIFPYLTLMNSQNLDLVVLQTNPVATYNFLKYDLKPETAVVVLDIGTEHTSLIIIHQDNFWVRNLPIAGNEVTKRLQKKLKITGDEAEELKKKMSESKQAQKVFKVIEPTLKELAGEVHRSMGYFKSQAGGVKFTHLVLLGGGSNMYGLSRFFENQLQVKVTRVRQFQNIKIGGSGAGILLGQRLPGFSTAVGLALQGLGLGSSSVNFLPKELRAIREAARQKPFFVVGALLILIGVILMAIKAGNDLELVKGQKKPVEKQIKRLEELAATFKKKERLWPIRHKLDNFLALIPSDRSRYVEDINRVMGLFTENFQYPRDDKDFKLTPYPETNKYVLLPIEQDKIFLFSMRTQLEIHGEGTNPRRGAGSPMTGMPVPVLTISVDGSIPHRKTLQGGYADDRLWTEDHVQKRLQVFFPKEQFPGVVFKLDAAEKDNFQRDFNAPWDPDDSDFEDYTNIVYTYYFFKAKVILPDYSQFYRLFNQQFNQAFKRQTVSSENLAEITDKCRRTAVKNIIRAYRVPELNINLTDAEIVNHLAGKMGDKELRELRTSLGIAIEETTPEDESSEE
ncbi:type IV pilus assembly protein PilM [Planctomycetota bacterium]